MWHFGLFLGVKPRRSRPPLYIQGAGGRGHAGLTQRPRQSAGRWAKTPHCITETNNPFPRASRPPRCQHRSTAPSRCSSFHPHRVPSFQRCGGYMSSRQLIRRRDPVYLLCPGEKRAHEHEQARAVFYHARLAHTITIRRLSRPSMQSTSHPAEIMTQCTCHAAQRSFADHGPRVGLHGPTPCSRGTNS